MNNYPLPQGSNTKKDHSIQCIYIYGIGNPGPSLGQALKCGWG